MTLLKRAVLLGVVMGVNTIASVYLVLTFLPPRFGIIIPIASLAIVIAVLWPTWFDRGDSVGVGRRFLRRLALVGSATLVSAVTCFLMVIAFPGYIEWTDSVHREHLQRQGLSAADIEARVAQHHTGPSHFLIDGAYATAAPGLIATLVTTAASAILLRKRPQRP